MGSNQVNSMYSFTSDEYNSLRNELIARIEAFNNQSTTAITTILTALASAIALLVLSFSNGISDRHIIMGFDIAQAIALLTPVLFLFPISLRSGENLVQITSLSCYIRVFYEKRPNSTHTIFAWEGANNAISSVNVKRKFISLERFINSEYTALSISAVLMHLAFALINYYRIIALGAYSGYLICFHIIIFVLDVIFVTSTALGSSMKRNYRDIRNKYIAGFVQYGIKKGYFPSSDQQNILISELLNDSTILDQDLLINPKEYLKSLIGQI